MYLRFAARFHIHFVTTAVAHPGGGRIWVFQHPQLINYSLLIRLTVTEALVHWAQAAPDISVCGDGTVCGQKENPAVTKELLAEILSWKIFIDFSRGLYQWVTHLTHGSVLYTVRLYVIYCLTWLCHNVFMHSLSA